MLSNSLHACFASVLLLLLLGSAAANPVASPPLAPTESSFLKSFANRKATRSNDKSSNCPVLTCATGKIAVHLVSNRTSLGYISENFVFTGTSTIGVLTKGPAFEALVVTLPSRFISVLKKPFNIRTVNGPDPSLPFLGAAQAADPLRTSSGGSAFLTATIQACPAGPANLQTSYLDFSGSFLGESKVWILDCKRKFYTDWINKDGSHFPATFFYYSKSQVHSTDDRDALGILGDRMGVQDQNLVTLLDVYLTFEPLDKCPETCKA